MKNLRILFVALFIAASFASPRIAGAETAKRSGTTMKRTSVTPQMVVNYLTALGYEVVTWPTLRSDGYSYTCTTIKNGTWTTITYCSASSIINHEDVPA